VNVLLTCAGRRNFLVRFFREAVGSRGRVYACDTSDSAPALAAAEHRFLVPPMDRSDYFDVLLAKCREHRIKLVFSVNDLELPGLAEQAPRFREQADTILVVSAPQTIAMCQDKWTAYQFLSRAGIGTPNTYRSLADARRALASGELTYPILLKPRWGTSSIGIERVENERELELALEWGKVQLGRTILSRLGPAAAENLDDCFLLQEQVEGHEYGLDVVNDLTGRHAATLARRKLVMRVGNTDRAITVRESRLEQLGRSLGEQLGHVGSLDCDVIATPAGCMVLDLNPRLGGGYPFSHLAGANLPAAFLAWAQGETPDPAWLRAEPGIVSSKFDDVLVVHRSEEKS
jgi:carbamoyl-phosphate synthase large subunit